MSGYPCPLQLGAAKIREWPLEVAFWAPRPQNTLVINQSQLLESLKIAAAWREQRIAAKSNELKKRLLRQELDALGDSQEKQTRDILKELQQLQDLASRIAPTGQTGQAPPPSGGAEGDSPDAAPKSSPGPSATYNVAVFPNDPSFAVSGDLRLELVAQLYGHNQKWLPNFGRWYSTLTGAAMQRRIFPKELKGSGNFQNSMSRKLIDAVLGVVLNITHDFYDDERHLPDTLAAICLANAYYYQKEGGQLPTEPASLTNRLGDKLKLLLSDLKKDPGERKSYQFAQLPAKQKETIAPLNKQNKYNPEFFRGHALFNLFLNSGLFPVSGPALDSVYDRAASQDLTLAITSAIFGDSIPPFIVYQWNLRVGLVALEVLLLAFSLVENIQASGNSATSRLQLRSLLGDEWQSPGAGVQFHKRGALFDFLVDNYISPSLAHKPSTPVSTLFPGIMLLAFEAQSHASSGGITQLIQLTTKKFNDIFEIINQRYTFRDAGPLIQAQVSLRLTIETGLHSLLTNLSGGNFAREIMKTQFGTRDDYDILYFLVFGFLPTAVATA